MALIRSSAPRLILYKALALSCLPLLAVGLTGPARAQSAGTTDAGWSAPVQAATGTWHQDSQSGNWTKNHPTVTQG